LAVEFDLLLEVVKWVLICSGIGALAIAPLVLVGILGDDEGDE
jgi:hypothetical protein